MSQAPQNYTHPGYEVRPDPEFPQAPANGPVKAPRTRPKVKG
jgi:hypothetical protein